MVDVLRLVRKAAAVFREPVPEPVEGQQPVVEAHQPVRHGKEKIGEAIFNHAKDCHTAIRFSLGTANVIITKPDARLNRRM